jgi:hypothetical protein
MPALIIYGMPVGQKELKSLVDILRSVVSDKLKLSKKRISVFFPNDHLQFGEKLICFVSGCGFSGTSEQIPVLRQDLANSILTEISTFVKNNVSQCSLIEIILQQEQATEETRWVKPQ